MNAHLLYESTANKNDYYDKRSKLTKEEYFDRLQKTSTLYVGNLSLFTTEEKIYTIFSGLGPVKNVLVGLHKKSFKPCGFAFIEFYTREQAENAVNYYKGFFIDGQKIKLDYDIGFSEGRQFGRGYSGGQVVDEFKNQYYY